MTGDFGIRAIVSSVLPGDFDGNGKVDGFDFLKWQVGMSPNSLSQSDLAVWEANYGLPPLSATAAVPESTTCALALAALCMALGRQCR